LRIKRSGDTLTRGRIAYLQQEENACVNYLMPIFVVAALALAGCSKSKSPEECVEGRSQSEQKASNEVTKSEDRAQSALDKSYEKVNDQEKKFNNDAATPNLQRGHRKSRWLPQSGHCDLRIAERRCSKACKDQAEADYKTARADARASAEVAVQPK